MVKSKLDPVLMAGFWESVHTILARQPGLDADRAWRAINSYRAELDHFGVGDMIYHEDQQELAHNLARRFSPPASPKRRRLQT